MPLVDIQGRQLKLSNLDKVLYPAAGFTKAHVIDYYARIGRWMVPHLRDRPLTFKRYPNGVEGEFFFEKNCPAHRPEWVKTARVQHSSEAKDYCLANDVPTLVWAANLAALELHPSLSHAARMEHPTMMVFDLDPGAPAALLECCQVAVVLRGMFQALKLKCFAKTSGGKGLQVYVPLNAPAVTYEDTKGFSRQVALLLEQQLPKLVVSNMKKELRVGKVLVDWSQNDEKKTTVAVYSLRARERPTASTPVSWDEVEEALKSRRPERLVFEAAEVLERVEKDGDLFEPTVTLKQKLPPLP
ncbi:MAG TPA: non-homologous end-joining DNA ligase [Myxococcales bacterium]|nr:non-homologous end-joining DNA ligase [Myxococcales bacterium]